MYDSDSSDEERALKPVAGKPSIANLRTPNTAHNLPGENDFAKY